MRKWLAGLLIPGLTAFGTLAEDGAQQVFPLTVEHASKLAGIERVTQLVVRPPDGLAGEVLFSVSLRGTPSNKASVTIQNSGSGPP